ncbi:MAG: adenylosuccinate synthase, partial [Phycisphaerae bacterium]
CPYFHVGVRYNGGANAGHTVSTGCETFALHLLPAAALHDHMDAVLGPGVVVDPVGLVDELDALAARGIDVGDRLKISDRAHLVLPYHKIEDRLAEHAATTARRIGTTARGIGPCYADKMRRTMAVRFSDVVSATDLTQRVRRIVAEKTAMFQGLYGDDGGLDPDRVLADIAAARRRLGPYITDTTTLLHTAVEAGRRTLFEGANGMLLDVDHGTYPFVTSSSTGSGGVAAGAGVPAATIRRVIGVTKAYATRVGSGPFVTELTDDIGDTIRTQGREFGTTTGRPRRCGWFDAVACRYTARLGGVTDVALMHLDTLSGLDRVGICTAYRIDGDILTTPPADAGRLERAVPVLEFLPGWSDDLRSVERLDDLPHAARAYVARLETLIGATVSLVSVGPDRTHTLTARDADAPYPPVAADSGP